MAAHRYLQKKKEVELLQNELKEMRKRTSGARECQGGVQERVGAAMGEVEELYQQLVPTL